MNTSKKLAMQRSKAISFSSLSALQLLPALCSMAGQQETCSYKIDYDRSLEVSKVELKCCMTEIQLSQEHGFRLAPLAFHLQVRTLGHRPPGHVQVTV